MPRPVNNLPIRISALLGAERRPSDQALEHNGPHAPPITPKIVAFAGKDFGSNIVWSAHGGIGKLSSRFAPSVDLITVADRELDLIDVDAITVCARVGTRGFAMHELLVVGGIMFFVESGREPKVSKLDMSAFVEQNVVGFDVTAMVSITQSFGSKTEKGGKELTDE